jgi:hypothetical protein
MWINGRDHPQLEPGLPEESNIPLGVNGTEHTDIMRDKLESLQNKEIYLEVLH